MHRFLNGLTALVLSLPITVTVAMPTHFTTHNKTNVESNAYVAGVPSRVPTAPHSDRSVNWASVLVACAGHVHDNQCTATIKMAPNSPNPIELGEVTLNILTGAITPQHLSAYGYTFNVDGPGEVTLAGGN